MILEKILLELADMSHPNGRLGIAVMKAKDSFVPLFSALNIVADNPAGGGGGGEFASVN